MVAKKRNCCRLFLAGVLFLLFLFGLTTQAHASWIENEDGTYSYQNEDGKIVRNKWINEKFYVNSKGVRLTGKHKIGSKWYYFSELNGKLQKGRWIRDGGNRYYAKMNGVLYSQGIYKIGEDKYLFDAKAVMKTGKCKFKEKTYYLLPKNGKMLTDRWIKELDGYFYYFDKKGVMARDKWLSGYTYYVDAKGRRVFNKWKDGRYLGSDGKACSGFQKISGAYYYFDPSTHDMLTNASIELDGKWWSFDDEGKGTKGNVPAPGRGVNVQPEYYKHPVADDETLLSYIIYCEAGNQLYEGKLGVGYVILNRVYSPLFPSSTVREVVYEKNQFNPVWDGAMERVYRNPSLVTAECKKAAKDVLKKRAEIAAGKSAKMKIGGKTISFNYLFFMRPESYQRLHLKSPYRRIGDHVFFVKWQR